MIRVLLRLAGSSLFDEAIFWTLGLQGKCCCGTCFGWEREQKVWKLYSVSLYGVKKREGLYIKSLRCPTPSRRRETSKSYLENSMPDSNTGYKAGKIGSVFRWEICGALFEEFLNILLCGSPKGSLWTLLIYGWTNTCRWIAEFYWRLASDGQPHFMALFLNNSTI